MVVITAFIPMNQKCLSYIIKFCFYHFIFMLIHFLFLFKIVLIKNYVKIF